MRPHFTLSSSTSEGKWLTYSISPHFTNMILYSNTGTTNSFTGVNVDDLSGGVINGDSLTKNNNFACLAFQFAANAKPDVLLGSLTKLTNDIGGIMSNLACPQLQSIDDSQLQQFPGYTKSQQ